MTLKELKTLILTESEIDLSRIQYGGTETLSPPGNILCPVGHILNYIKSLCIIFVLNWFIYSDQKNQTIFIQKRFNKHRAKYNPRGLNIPILHTTDTHFYNSSTNIGSISLLSFFGRHQSQYPLGCHVIDINSSLNSVLSSLRFSYLIC